MHGQPTAPATLHTTVPGLPDTTISWYGPDHRAVAAHLGHFTDEHGRPFTFLWSLAVLTVRGVTSCAVGLAAVRTEPAQNNAVRVRWTPRSGLAPRDVPQADRVRVMTRYKQAAALVQQGARPAVRKGRPDKVTAANAAEHARRFRRIYRGCLNHCKIADPSRKHFLSRHRDALEYDSRSGFSGYLASLKKHGYPFPDAFR